MFEGHIKKAGTPHEGESRRESEVLRRLRWTDLVARLAATRDLREELDQPCEAGFAGFSASRDELGENGKSAVNQDALSHRKFAASNPVDAANDAAQGDRDDL